MREVKRYVGQRQRRDKNRGEWQEEEGSNCCLRPCARTEEELGSLATADLLHTKEKKEITHRLRLRPVAKQHAQLFHIYAKISFSLPLHSERILTSVCCDVIKMRRS